MVKALFLGLLAVTMCGFACAAPAPQLSQPNRLEEMPPTPPQPPLEDPAARSERSTNLSHVTGTARKIQMFIKNRHLQLLPDGIVNGTTDDTSVYSEFFLLLSFLVVVSKWISKKNQYGYITIAILQRTTIGIGQMKIQGVATCQYLCMDSCGLLYGSREFGDECIFNETIEQHHYNTYSSTKYSNERRTLYLALNRRGQSRKVLLRAHQQLGKLSSYTRVLTRTVPQERTEELHPVRHHAHLCSPTSNSELNGRLAIPTADRPNDSPRCRKRKKRKKKKRKCPIDGDHDTDLCHKRQNISNHRKLQPNRLVKKCENEDSDECQRDVTINKKKQKTNLSDKLLMSGPNKKKKNFKKGAKKRQQVIAVTSTEVTATAADDINHDEDYGLDSTTHWDWEDSTAIPDMSISMSMPGAPTSAQPD